MKGEGMHGVGRFWCVFGVVAGLLALPFQAGADDAAALGRAGALLWEMSELHHEFGDRHIARGVPCLASVLLLLPPSCALLHLPGRVKAPDRYAANTAFMARR
jgi:hypothetical protein